MPIAGLAVQSSLRRADGNGLSADAELRGFGLNDRKWGLLVLRPPRYEPYFSEDIKRGSRMFEDIPLLGSVDKAKSFLYAMLLWFLFPIASKMVIFISRRRS